MHEQQSWPDDLALASLRHAAAAFVDLDSTPTLDDLRSRSSARSTYSAARLNSARTPGSTIGKSSRSSVTPGASRPIPFHRAGAELAEGLSRRLRDNRVPVRRGESVAATDVAARAGRVGVAQLHRRTASEQGGVPGSSDPSGLSPNQRPRPHPVDWLWRMSRHPIDREHTVGDGRRIRVVRYRLRGARLRASRTRSACRQMHVSQRHGSSRPEEAGAVRNVRSRDCRRGIRLPAGPMGHAERAEHLGDAAAADGFARLH